MHVCVCSRVYRVEPEREGEVERARAREADFENYQDLYVEPVNLDELAETGSAPCFTHIYI